MEFKLIDEKHIVRVETHIDEQLIAKPTLEAQRADHLAKIAEIDDMLKMFVAAK